MVAAAPKPEGFRQAMSWLHTWSGLVLGWLLFAIFVTGTLSFFKDEFNLWMRPELHGSVSRDAPLDVAMRAQAALHQRFPGVTHWILRLPDDRLPVATALGRASSNGRFETVLLDPQTGRVLVPRETMGGEFFYRFHFELRTAYKGRWALQGRWIVGVATLLMFVALLTGVVTHRRIFKDFFTFRPGRNAQRAWLDAHNVSGVLALPFYLMITFSGLMIFHAMYMPAGIAAVYRTAAGGTDSAAYFAELQGDTSGNVRGTKGDALPVVDLAPLFAQAATAWQGGGVGHIAVRQGKDGVLVELARRDGERLQYGPPRLQFDSASGWQPRLQDPQSATLRTYGVLYGLHLGRFAGPTLRWVLFGMGVLGSLMIATGLVLWSVKRRAQSVRKGQTRLVGGDRLVASLNVGLMGGLPLALAAYLLANRLWPVASNGRADAELTVFFATWLGVLLVGCWQPNRRGWAVVLGAAGVAWLALPFVNALTTHTHLGVSLPAGEWIWAGMDLGFLATAIGLLLVARHLLRPVAPPPARSRALAGVV